MADSPRSERPRTRTFDKPKVVKVIGVQPLREALAAGRQFDRVLLRRGLNSPAMKGLLKELTAAAVPLQFVPPQKLNHEAGRTDHQGAIGFMATVPYQPLEELVLRVFESGDAPLFLLPAGVTDIRNLGAIARSAEAAGVHGLILSAKGRTRINADALRTSAGALQHLPVSRVPSNGAALEYLSSSGILPVGVVEDGEHPLWRFDFRQPVCLVLGAEDEGLTRGLREQLAATVRIPMAGQMNSLNVSVAAGMALYETVRQRNI